MSASTETKGPDTTAEKNVKESIERFLSSDADAKLIQPCDIYKAQTVACMHFYSRLRQLYYYGEFSDCKLLREVYDNCEKIEKHMDSSYQSMLEVVKFEKERIEKCEKASEANNVWNLRKSPPENWNNPYPEFMEPRKKSYLYKHQYSWKEDTYQPPFLERFNVCVIS